MIKLLKTLIKNKKYFEKDMQLLDKEIRDVMHMGVSVLNIMIITLVIVIVFTFEIPILLIATLSTEVKVIVYIMSIIVKIVWIYHYYNEIWE